MVTAPTETYDRRWSPVLPALRADALDCVQANLAVLADVHAGAGAHLELGAQLRFDTEPGADGVPRVVRSVPHRLAAAHDLLGLRVARRWDGVDGAGLRELTTGTGPLLVVADAYDLSWTPYAGRQHTEHTFVLPAPDTAVDAYHDETPWGQQRPGVWRLSPAALDTITDATALLLAAEPVPPRPGMLAANARALADAAPAIDTYLAALRGGGSATAAGLVVDVWLLGRSRLLHAAWLARHGEPAAEAESHARDWLSLAAKSFVASRRAGTAGTLPAGVLTELARLLHEDVELAGRLAAAGGPAPPDHTAVRAALVAAIRDVLRVDEPAITAARTLRELPNYNSFRLVDIIERVETRLGLVLDDEALTPQALHDVDSLCRAFAERP